MDRPSGDRSTTLLASCYEGSGRRRCAPSLIADVHSRTNTQQCPGAVCACTLGFPPTHLLILHVSGAITIPLHHGGRENLAEKAAHVPAGIAEVTVDRSVMLRYARGRDVNLFGFQASRCVCVCEMCVRVELHAHMPQDRAVDVVVRGIREAACCRRPLRGTKQSRLKEEACQRSCEVQDGGHSVVTAPIEMQSD